MPPGQALKSPSQRINNHPPVRGEWVDLPEQFEPVLPAYPMAWYKRTARAMPKWIWDYWRSDSVTTQWAPGDHALALELGENWHALTPEYRLRVQTMLGLNSKGRRDLRWRNPAETESAKKADAHAAEARRLRIVGERKAS